MTICTRPSCGADHPPSSSAFLTSECSHHPGEPVFHEGQKSWSCCKEVNKPVLDFDDFVQIAGCTTVKGHSAEKRTKKADENGDKAAVQGEEPKVDQNGKEVYGNGAAASSSMSASSSKTPASKSAAAAPAPPKPSAPQPYVEPRDPEGATIPVGSICKRPGCGAKYDDTTPRDPAKEQCKYHKGAPLFHEGTKGYTCCKRRVLEFNEFLKIEPCTAAESGHLFLQPPKPSAPSSSDSTASNLASEDPLFTSNGLAILPGESAVDVRMDHYETRDSVHLTFYCRGLDVEKSRIVILTDDLLLSLSMGCGTKRHLLHLRLYGSVEPATETEIAKGGGEGQGGSTWTVSPSKIKLDVVLQKRDKGRSWPTLQRGEGGGGYGLTFGTR
ncbi:chord-domain-containing protein [Jaminaea rosea]|uniref:Chord-domain-containing protein n=1 Tax=Jaminaea rosea TaxID=1569628 RepID=A0A316UL70_9BASI|nr:chord-domain-containing protein [Jaminaea rosea]PWN25990.1 chord-domain-containing protein [Jaminaea rosea]